MDVRCVGCGKQISAAQSRQCGWGWCPDCRARGELRPFFSRSELLWSAARLREWGMTAEADKRERFAAEMPG